jgi:hypothetical protein
MNRNRQANDPQRDRNSRNERGDLGHVGENVGNRERESDLGRKQAEGDLGNERVRDRNPSDADMDDGEI